MIVFFVGNPLDNCDEAKELIAKDNPTIAIVDLASISEIPNDLSERFVLFQDAAGILNNLKFFQETYVDLMRLIPVGTSSEVREIQKNGIEISEFTDRKASGVEITSLVEELLSIRTPKVVDDDFFNEGQVEMASDELDKTVDVEFKMDPEEEVEETSDENDELFDVKDKIDLSSDEPQIELPSLDLTDDNLTPTEEEEVQPEPQNEGGIDLDLSDDEEELELSDSSEESVEPTTINLASEDEGGIELGEFDEGELSLDDGSEEQPMSVESENESNDTIELSPVDGVENNLEVDNSDIQVEEGDFAGLDLDSMDNLNIEEDDKEIKDDDDLPEITEDDDQIDDDALEEIDEDEENDLSQFDDTMHLDVAGLNEEEVAAVPPVEDNDPTGDFDMGEDNIETLDELDADSDEDFTVDLSEDELVDDDLSVPDVLPPTIENVEGDDDATKTVLQVTPTEAPKNDTQVVHEKIDYNYDENEMVKLQLLIRGLREDREKLIGDLAEKEEEIKKLKKDNYGLQAELEETKISLKIEAQNREKKTQEANELIQEGERKKQNYEAKIRELTQIAEEFRQQVRLDVRGADRKVKELESQLELVKMDADSNIKTRDNVIMDLKRKIDTLEFNMENMENREHKFKEEKALLEDKNNQLLATLKKTMKALEDD